MKGHIYQRAKGSWTIVYDLPGDTVTGGFTVENVGEPGSQLDWGIESFPDWGNWTFTSLDGEDLTPEDGGFEIQVTVIAPDKKNKRFNGGVKIVNKDSGGDRCYIQVSLATTRNKEIRELFPLFLERFKECFPFLRNLLEFQYFTKNNIIFL